jgi:hypothetical protein
VFDHVSTPIRTYGKHHCVCGILCGESKSQFDSGVGFRMILHRSWPEGWGSAPFVVSEPRKSSLLSVAEKRGTFYSHGAEEKR